MKRLRRVFYKKFKLGRMGFSLVELLAAIVILGVISTLSIIAVSRLIDRAKENHYSTQEKNMVLAAQSYFDNSKNELPKTLGQQKKLTLKKLRQKNLIDKVLDYGKNECDEEKSYVKVIKYGEGKYNYLAYLVCDHTGYNTKKNNAGSDFDPPTVNLSYNDVYKTSKVTLVIEDDDSGVLSYGYTVYKIFDSNNESVINTSGEKLGGTEKKVKDIIDLTQQIPGVFRFVVEAVDIYGNKRIVDKTEEIIDNTGPVCGVQGSDKSEVIIKTGDVEKELNYKTGSIGKTFIKEEWADKIEWTNQNRTVTVNCYDKDSGCKKDKYSVTFEKDTSIGYIKIKDNNGNVTKCKVPVFIDKTAPEIKTVTSPYEAKWINNNFSIVLTGEDQNYSDDVIENKASGVSYFSYSYADSKRSNEGDGVWEDYCSRNETSACINNSKWTKTDGNRVEFRTSYFSKERNMYVYFKICDVAGNCTVLDKTNSKTRSKIQIDKTSPEVTAVGNEHNDTWVNEPYTVRVESTDPAPEKLESNIISGVAKIRHRFSNWDEWQDLKNSKGQEVSTNKYVFNPKNYGSNNYGETKNVDSIVYYGVCDVAGNCSSDTPTGKGNNSTKIKIDQIKPNCYYEGYNEKNSIVDLGALLQQVISLWTVCSDPESDNGVASGCPSTKNQVVAKIDRILGFDEGMFSVTDRAGNVQSCAQQTVKVDVDPPVITSIINKYDGATKGFTNVPKNNPDAYKIEINSHDDGSGIASISYSYPFSSRSDEAGKEKIYDGSSHGWMDHSNFQFFTTPFRRERNDYVYFKVCDYAENCTTILNSNSSQIARSLIRIDTTNPVIDSVDNPYSSYTNAPKLNANSYVIKLKGHDPSSSDYPQENNLASGLRIYKYKYSGTDWTEYPTKDANNNDLVADNLEYKTTPFKKERDENVYFQLCDKAGNCSSNKTSLIQIDTTDPVCTVTAKNASNAARYDRDNPWNTSNVWSNTSVVLTPSCNANTGSVNSPCSTSNNLASYTVSEETTPNGKDYSFRTISDEAGNTAVCKGTAYIDKKAPSCSVTATNTYSNYNGENTENRWASGRIDLTGTCSDEGGSGCDPNNNTSTGYRTTNTASDGSVSRINSVLDKAGNIGICEKKVYFDKNPPSCSATATNYGSTYGAGYVNTNSNWSNASVNVTSSCTDNISGCTAPQATSYSYTTSRSGDLVTTGSAVDKAGNTADCSTTIYVDKEPPSCSNIVKSNCNAGWDGWCKAGTTGEISVTADCDDGTTGSKCQSGYTGVKLVSSSSDGSYSGGSYIYDNAGNYNYCSSNLYIDRTLPSVTNTYSNSYLNYSASAYDSGSGLYTYGFNDISSDSCSDYYGTKYCTSVTSYRSKTDTTTGSHSFYAYDNAGNYNSSSATNYQLCSSKIAMKDAALIYKWGSVGVNGCNNTGKIDSGEFKRYGMNVYGPYLEVNMTVKKCKCQYDVNYAKFSSGSISDSVYCDADVLCEDSTAHTDGMAIIAYSNDDPGRTACNKGNTTDYIINQHVQAVCRLQGEQGGKHGWYFYPGERISSDGIKNVPKNKWLHSGIKSSITTINNNDGVNNQDIACEYACKYASMSTIDSVGVQIPLNSSVYTNSTCAYAGYN